MEFIDESLAKGIVKRDLRNLTSTIESMRKVCGELRKRRISHPRVIPKIVPKILKKHGSRLLYHQVPISKDAGFTFVSLPVGITNANKYKDQVKMDSKPRSVHFTIYKGSYFYPNSENCLSIMALGVREFWDGYCEELVRLTNHALVRMTQRMQCHSLDGVVKEITDSSEMILHAHNEFRVYIKQNGIDPNINRFIPTKNGVAVMRVTQNSPASKMYHFSIVTWISNKQLFDEQKITQRELVLNQVASLIRVMEKENEPVMQYGFKLQEDDPIYEVYVRRGDYLFTLKEMQETVFSDHVIEETLSF